MNQSTLAQSSMYLIGASQGWGAGPTDSDCGICTLRFHSWQTTVTHTANRCNHTFHHSCLRLWLIEQTQNDRITSCPFCRGFLAAPSLAAFVLMTQPGPQLAAAVYTMRANVPVERENRPRVTTPDAARRLARLIYSAVREWEDRGGVPEDEPSPIPDLPSRAEDPARTNIHYVVDRDFDPELVVTQINLGATLFVHPNGHASVLPSDELAAEDAQNVESMVGPGTWLSIWSPLLGNYVDQRDELARLIYVPQAEEQNLRDRLLAAGWESLPDDEHPVAQVPGQDPAVPWFSRPPTPPTPVNPMMLPRPAVAPVVVAWPIDRIGDYILLLVRESRRMELFPNDFQPRFPDFVANNIRLRLHIVRGGLRRVCYIYFAFEGDRAEVRRQQEWMATNWLPNVVEGEVNTAPPDQDCLWRFRWVIDW